MKPEPVAVDERRLAALTVHALDPVDRHWVLDHLTGAQRIDLEALLAELETLAIPRDRELLDAVISPRPLASLPDAPPAILRADSAVLAELFASEPDALVSRCLALLEDSQREEVLGLLPRDRQATVATASAGIAAGPALTAAISGAIGEALARQEASEAFK